MKRIKDMDELVRSEKLLLSDNFVIDVSNIIESGRGQAYSAVSQTSIITFWNIGKRIVEEEQHGESRAIYGSKLIYNLSNAIVPLYGNCYSKRNLEYYRKFYLLFPNIEIVNTCVQNLEWSQLNI